MIYQSYDKSKYKYLLRVEMDNYDFLCRIAVRNDVSVAFLINNLIEDARQGDIPLRVLPESRDISGTCQKK